MSDTNHVSHSEGGKYAPQPGLAGDHEASGSYRFGGLSLEAAVMVGEQMDEMCRSILRILEGTDE